MDSGSLISEIMREAKHNLEYVEDCIDSTDLSLFEEYLEQWTFSELCDTYSYITRPKQKRTGGT